MKTADLFGFLSDQTRINILKTLSTHKNYCVTDISKRVNLSLSATSHQLRKLEHLGVVEKCRNGQEICYCINNKSALTKRIMRLLKTAS